MKIKIDGIIYELDVEGAKRNNTLKIHQTKCVGEWYKVKGFKNPFILAQVNPNEVTLIDTHKGNRLFDPVRVKNCNYIENDEWEKIIGGTDVELVSVNISM